MDAAPLSMADEEQQLLFWRDHKVLRWRDAEKAPSSIANRGVVVITALGEPLRPTYIPGLHLCSLTGRDRGRGKHRPRLWSAPRSSRLRAAGCGTSESLFSEAEPAHPPMQRSHFLMAGLSPSLGRRQSKAGPSCFDFLPLTRQRHFVHPPCTFRFVVRDGWQADRSFI